MMLFKEWNTIINKQISEKEKEAFWTDFFKKETNFYEVVLESKESELKGIISDLALKYEITNVEMIGLLDGINTSLTKELNLEELTADSEIKVKIDFEKLYYNMHNAKAHWLFSLSQWEDILTTEKRNEIEKNYKRDTIAISEKIGRNVSCPCGSNKKYKKCCGK